MNKLFLKAKRAIRFLFYKDISIVDQIKISKILDNEQLEQLFWKMSKADRHHSLEVLERTMKYSNNEDLLKLSLLHDIGKSISEYNWLFRIMAELKLVSNRKAFDYLNHEDIGYDLLKELSFLLDALKSLLINYTSNNSQIDESLNDLFSSLESKNLNNEIENYAEFILLASSLFELKAKRMLPQEEEIQWMDEVEVLKDKDLAFARLLQFKAFSEIGIALASKIKYNENEIKSFKYYQTKNLFPKPDVEYEINKDKFNEVAIEVFDRFKTIEGFKHIDKDLPDLQKAIDDLLHVVDKRLNTSFESILNEVNTEKEAIAFFLALLEAVRWGFVKASQNDAGIKIEKNYEL